MSQPPPAPRASQPLRIQAARIAWIAPLLVVLFNFLLLGAQQRERVDPSGWGNASTGVAALFSLLAVLVGLICGIGAIIALLRHKTPGYLGQAIIGTVVNLAIVAVWIFGLLFLSSVHSRLAAPIDRSLTTATYISRGVPDITRPWTAADYTTAANALNPVVASDVNALPRWKSPSSGRLFSHMVDLANTDGPPGSTVAERLQANGALAQAIVSLGHLYGDAENHGAHYDDELTEFCAFGLQITDKLLADMHQFLASIPPDDPRHDRAAELFAQTGNGVNEVVQGTLDMLQAAPPANTAPAVRLAQYARDFFPPLLRELNARQRTALATRIHQIRDRHAAGPYRTALDALTTVIDAAR